MVWVGMTQPVVQVGQTFLVTVDVAVVGQQSVLFGEGQNSVPEGRGLGMKGELARYVRAGHRDRGHLDVQRAGDRGCRGGALDLGADGWSGVGGLVAVITDCQLMAAIRGRLTWRDDRGGHGRVARRGLEGAALNAVASGREDGEEGDVRWGRGC